MPSSVFLKRVVRASPVSEFSKILGNIIDSWCPLTYGVIPSGIGATVPQLGELHTLNSHGQSHRNKKSKVLLKVFTQWKL